MVTDGPGNDRITAECAFLAANVKIPGSDELMIDRVIMYANTVRAARKARWPKNCIAPLEADLIRVLTQYARWIEWYRHGCPDKFPA
jgi:hypothetical protein